MKPWKADIERHIQMWSARLGNLSWWPQYVYHFTDVQNAASIIQSGHLHSRAEAERRGLMKVDNWAPRIRLGEPGLYERRWTYAEEVVTVDDVVIFRFNPNTLTPGPFQVSFSYCEAGKGSERTWKGEQAALNNLLHIRIPDAI